jgi:hypothetical protein
MSNLLEQNPLYKCLLLLTLCAGCTIQRAPDQPHTKPVALAQSTTDDKAPDPAAEAVDWKKDVADVLGRPGVLNAKEQVYTVTIPRDDIDLKIDGMSVPTAAGIASTFHFYLCSCGKTSVLGEFIVVDYEANDVIDALRPGAIIRVTAVSPIAIGDKPRLLSVRFHGEGDAAPMAKLIKEALRWTGEARLKGAKE